MCYIESCEQCHIYKMSTQTTSIVESVDSVNQSVWNSILCDEMFGVTEDLCTIELADDSIQQHLDTGHSQGLISAGAQTCGADVLLYHAKCTVCNVALGKLNEHQSRVCRDL